MQHMFAVLGSGSSGNCSFLGDASSGILIDLGLGPRQIATRLLSIGRSWESVRAAILTHTHCDHWKEPTLGQLLQRAIPVYCHADHVRQLTRQSSSFGQLSRAGLLRHYVESTPQSILPGLRCRSFAVSHDCAPTFGFRFDYEPTLFQPSWSLAYVADLGCWTEELLPYLLDVEILALEFNHDVQLQRNSGRPVRLIDRVLGNEGHLSNEQAAELLSLVVTRSSPGRLRSMVQLHLSRQCNCPTLASTIASRTLSEHGSAASVVTADQSRPVLSMI